MEDEARQQRQKTILGAFDTRSERERVNCFLHCIFVYLYPQDNVKKSKNQDLIIDFCGVIDV